VTLYWSHLVSTAEGASARKRPRQNSVGESWQGDIYPARGEESHYKYMEDKRARIASSFS